MHQARLSGPGQAAPATGDFGLRFSLPRPASIAPANRPHTLVTRWANAPRETAEESARYGCFMANAIRKSAQALSDGSIGGLDALWLRARDERRKSFLVQKNVMSAEELGQEHAVFYERAGTARAGSALLTVMSNRYAYINRTVADTAISLFAHPDSRMPNLWRNEGMLLVRYPDAVSTGGTDYRLQIASHGQVDSTGVSGVPASRIVWNLVTLANTGSPEDFLHPDGLSLVVLENPAARAARDGELDHIPGYRKARHCMERAMAAEDPGEILGHAFRAYWHLVVAAPDIRGSAAKSHYVLQSILLAKGIELPPARVGMAPDLEAMARSPQAWQAHAPFVFGL